MPPTMTKIRRPIPRPPCRVLVQGMVNLSPAAYKYRGENRKQEGGKNFGEGEKAVTEREAR